MLLASGWVPRIGHNPKFEARYAMLMNQRIKCFVMRGKHLITTAAEFDDGNGRDRSESHTRSYSGPRLPYCLLPLQGKRGPV